MLVNLECVECGKDLAEDINDGIIVLQREKNGKTVDVKSVCRGECDNNLDRRLRAQGYGIGTKEMNTGLRNLYIEEDFTDVSLEKYKDIVETINQVQDE